MNVKKYNLRKVAGILLLVLAVTFALIDVIGWNRLEGSQVGPAGVIAVEAVLYAVAAFFCIRMVRKDRKGESTALGNFFQTIARSWWSGISRSSTKGPCSASSGAS